MGKVLLSMAFLGGSVCAAFVVALAAAWGVCEAKGDHDQHALDLKVSEAPLFYASYALIIACGLGVLCSGVDAVLMPLALLFLFLLATGSDLPEASRVRGWHKLLTGSLFATCSACALYSAFQGF